MSKEIKISIPSPCHENWAPMTPVEKGRFCGSCQKVVHDFTALTDNEIAAIISKDRTGCGMFLSTQLNRNLKPTRKKSHLWSSMGAAMVSVFAVDGNIVSAQEQTITEQCEPGNRVRPSSFNHPPGMITGIVYDGARSPLAGATVMVIGTQRKTTTDNYGSYSIEAVPGDVLQFSAKKVISSEIIVEEGKNDYFTILYYKRKSKNNYRTLGRYF